MAIIVGCKGNLGMRVEKTFMPRGGVMTPEKIIEAYLHESKKTDSFTKDDKAATLFNSFQKQEISVEGGVPHKVFANVLVDPLHQGKKTFRKERGEEVRTYHSVVRDKGRCVCCQSIDFAQPAQDQDRELVSAFTGKKYKPVGLKIRPIYTELPDKYRIKREIKGDPLARMPKLNPTPSDFVPGARYTTEQKDDMEARHGEFLQPKEIKLMHEFVRNHEQAFAWTDEERGRFRHDFFPPVEFPVVEHETWVEKSIPILRGQLKEFCKAIKNKLDAGVYEPSNVSYRSKFFGVIKKDGKSIRLVHALEPLNAVTIVHSGLPPATEELANHFSGRACGGCLDLYSGYDHRDIAEGSRDFTTFQTPFGALRLVKLPQGWTNSVPIFHNDVNYILREEIPHITMSYIDDVPIRGPGTKYILPDGTCEVIPENPGIRRFIWEHFENLNRVVQRVKYCGGTFSGAKSVLCAGEFHVVGHLYSFEGRKPDTDRVGVIQQWGPLKDVSGV
jgi:hypothetical protein